MSKSTISNHFFAIAPEEAVDFHLRSAWLDVSRMYNEIAVSKGISMSMAFILINISKKGSNPTKIGPKMGMQANSLSRTLKTLEDKGLIYKAKKEGDQREVAIFLTEFGLEARKIANSIIADFNQHFYNNISKEKLDAFKEVVSQVHRSAHHMRERFGVKDEEEIG